MAPLPTAKTAKGIPTREAIADHREGPIAAVALAPDEVRIVTVNTDPDLDRGRITRIVSRSIRDRDRDRTLAAGAALVARRMVAVDVSVAEIRNRTDV